MSDTVKTLIFAGVAIVCAVLAVFISMPPEETRPEDFVGKPLFADFTDPSTASSLEIVKVDEKLGKLQKFQVDRSPQGRWVIPSHGGYPADATEQMRDAATSLINLNVLAKVSDLPGDQEMYGVIEPTEARVESGEKGFGMIVDFKDKSGKDLAGIIIGKNVKDSQTQRFVRKIGQDPIYVVEMDTNKLTTKFSDWIEKDLLKVSPWDIDRVTIKDYQFLPRQESDGRIALEFDPRLDVTVGLADANVWEIDRLTQYQKGRPVATQLNDDEELNKEKLDELKSAIDNLQIVDVQPKPKGLGGDLSVDDAAVKNAQLVQSLQGLGFMPVSKGNKKYEFLGTNGEVNVGLKDGVEYVLRFGNSAGADSVDGKSKRYLFVLARLDESRLQPPSLEALPEAPADVPAPADSGEKKDEAAADDDKKSEDKKDEQPKDTEFDLKRKRIERENQRKLDDYNERRKKAAAKVRELNARFAPWYYIISDDEFKKVHLTRAEVVKEKSGAGVEGFGPDALRDLQKGGIQPPPPPMPVGGPGLQGLPPGIQLPGM